MSRAHGVPQAIVVLGLAALSSTAPSLTTTSRVAGSFDAPMATPSFAGQSLPRPSLATSSSFASSRDAPLEAPPGWRVWDPAPASCRVFVPEKRLSTPVKWEPCSFAARGCARAEAPWAAESGWGFGGLLSAASIHGQTYVSVSRSPARGWWESLLFAGDRLVAAWRQKIPESGCLLGGPWLRSSGAAIVIVPVDMSAAIAVAMAHPDLLLTRPAVDDVDRVGLAGLPSDVVDWSPRRLVVMEQDQQFVIRERGSDMTYRARPGVADGVARDPIVADDPIFYSVRVDRHWSVWANVGRGIDRPLLRDDAISFEGFDTDGTTAAFVRRDAGGNVELWVADVVESGLANARRMAGLPADATPLLRVGDGWIAAHLNGSDVRLYRARDGLERRAPNAPGLEWHGGRFGAALASGHLWLKAHRAAGPGNDIRSIVRFDLAALAAR